MEVTVTPKALCTPHVRRFLATAVVASVGAFASPAFAACVGTGTVTCTDTTAVEAYKNSTLDTHYSGTGFVAGKSTESGTGNGDAVQSASHSYDTSQLVATISENRGNTAEALELTFTTAFNGDGGITSSGGPHYADIFLSTLGTSKSPSDTFNYAISLGTQSSNGGVAAGFYGNISDKTSTNIWGSSGLDYGGAYQGFDNAWHAAPTVLTGGTALTGSSKSDFWLTTNSETCSSVTKLCTVDVKLWGLTADFNGLFSSGLSVFWGTADCDNDPIEAFIAYDPITRVPEPMTLSLFGAGVAGVAAMRRRRKAKAA